jgi:hypothetical protein
MDLELGQAAAGAQGFDDFALEQAHAQVVTAADGERQESGDGKKDNSPALHNNLSQRIVCQRCLDGANCRPKNRFFRLLCG